MFSRNFTVKTERVLKEGHFIMLRDMHKQSGVGLLEALLAVGILGFVAVSMSSMMSNTFSLQRKAEIDNERLLLFDNIRKITSCEETYKNLQTAQGTCGSQKDKQVTVFNASGPYVSSAGTLMGKWSVVAFCREGAGLDFRVARVGNTPGSQIVDPVTKLPLGYDHPKNRLNSLCSEVGNGSLAEPDLECITASRKRYTITASKPNVVSAYDVGTPGTSNGKWGILCGSTYNRMSCALSTPTSAPKDVDINMIPRGCASDDDEWNGGYTMQMVCCKLTRSQ